MGSKEREASRLLEAGSRVAVVYLVPLLAILAMQASQGSRQPCVSMRLSDSDRCLSYAIECRFEEMYIACCSSSGHARRWNPQGTVDNSPLSTKDGRSARSVVSVAGVWLVPLVLDAQLSRLSAPHHARDPPRRLRCANLWDRCRG